MMIRNFILFGKFFYQLIENGKMIFIFSVIFLLLKTVHSDERSLRTGIYHLITLTKKLIHPVR
jgi:hypothetical protein